MVVPLIPLTIWGITAVTGGIGAVLGGKGALEMARAKKEIDHSKTTYQYEWEQLEKYADEVNLELVRLGELQALSVEKILDRLANFLRTHDKEIALSEKLLLDGMNTASDKYEIPRARTYESAQWLRGTVGSLVAGAGTRAAVKATVIQLAKASTGTAIKTLSGAAAKNATLAAIGGGSLAAGGGGMAAGVVLLNVVTIGPGILITGFTIAQSGEKEKTRATIVKAEIATELEKLNFTQTALEAIHSRTSELRDILSELIDRAEAALDELESEPFDPQNHAERFKLALVTALGVKDVAAAQVIGDDGQLNDETTSITLKYRPLEWSTKHD